MLNRMSMLQLLKKKKNVVLEQNLGSNQIVDPLKICNSFKPTLAPDSEPFVASLERMALGGAGNP